MITMSLLNLEARSARMSAVLDARPDLGVAWRRMAAVCESCASLSMEDVPVPEHDILAPVLQTSLVTAEPQAARTAGRVHTLLLRPGDIISEPSEVIRRALDEVRLTSLVDEEDGGRVALPSPDERADLAAAIDDLSGKVPSMLTGPEPVTFRLIAFCGLLRARLPEPFPIAERVLFMAAESAMRRREILGRGLVGTRTADADHRVDAQWTLMPSSALSRNGFRAWSPLSDTGISTLADRLDAALSHHAGSLGQLQKWSERVDGFTGRNRKSRRSGLARLCRDLPVMNADCVMRKLDVSRRTALTLIDDAVEQGILRLVAPRRSYRIWATAPMADMMTHRPSRPDRPVRPEADPAPSGPRTGPFDWTSDDALVAASSQLDDAIERADRILRNYTTSATRS